jgi:hypothetical protein
MNKIPTAEKWLENHKELSMYQVAEYNEGGYNGIDEEALYRIMIEFAKLHVQEALKVASEEATVTPIDHEEISEGSFRPIWGVDDDSILNAYPLENIK